MIGRLISTAIIVFWLTMTTALVRLEFFPERMSVNEVPSELVLRKIFNNTDSPGMNVYYHGTPLGFCKVEFTPVMAPSSNGVTPVVISYRVQSELTLTIFTGSVTNRMRLIGDSYFNPKFEMESFLLRSGLGEGRLQVKGDSVSNKVVLDVDIGDYRDHRVMDFARIREAGLAGAMGIPGLSSFGLVGGVPISPGGLGMTQPTTRIYLTQLRLGEAEMRAFLVESKLDESLWSKMWVSQRGEILKVETSLGVSMVQNTFAQDEMNDSN